MTAPAGARAGASGRSLADVAVVVVAYEAPDALRACLDALAGSDAGSVVVVDNASTHPDVEALSAHPVVTRWIRNPDNRGYAGGHNVGVAAALALGAEWVCLLNPDCVLAAGALAALRATAEEPGTGAVGPLLRDGAEPGRIWSAGGRLDWRRGVAVALHAGKRTAERRTASIDYISGACLFVSRAAWEAVGPLDESYFLYFEDVEWCARARARGLSLRVEPGAVVYHDWGSSSRARRGELSETALYYSARNRRHAFDRAAMHLGRPGLRIGAWFGTLHYIAAVLLFERDKIAKLRAIVAGVRAAGRGERGRRAG